MKSDKPITAHILPFLDYCEIEKGLSSNTQRNYKQYLQVFELWLTKTGNSTLLPHNLTAEHVWEYRLYLARTYKSPAGKHLSKKSQNYYLIALRALLNYFSDRDMGSLPSTKVKLAKQKTEEAISFLEYNDIESIVAVPDTSTPKGLRDRAIMELLFSSGMRIAELVALDQDQMSFLKDGSTDKTYELAIVGKGNRVRTIFISPRAAQWLREYLGSR
ncbi:MAG: tyrosine-type recombinase/integrase, partial [Candidatus Paceibacterota bacterium]